MAYTEFAWRSTSGSITHIDARIQQLLGYTAEEIKRLLQSASALAPWARQNFGDLLSGPPNAIAPHTYAPCPLRHKDGHEVACEVVAICRYDAEGELAELFGMVRPYPAQEELHGFLDWWLVAGEAQRRAVCGLMDLLAR